MMRPNTRNVFILAGILFGYGMVLWLAETKLSAEWASSFASDPKAIFSRDHDRDRMITEELNVPDKLEPSDDGAA